MPVDLPQRPPDPPELPPWVVMQSENPVLRSVLAELFTNEQFRADMDGAFGQAGTRQMFPAYVGDAAGLEKLNSTRKQKLRIPKEAGAISAYGMEPDSTMRNAAMYVDLDKLHRATGQDSARARELVRDALIHEFGHLRPVATSRHGRDITGDPKPGDRNVTQHPVIQQENLLRQMLGLQPKDFYGLVQENERGKLPARNR